MEAIRVLVVDDHRLVAQAIMETLSRAPNIEVLGVEDTARGGIRAARSGRPDVVLMDFDLPDLDGASATRQILKSSPETKVVMVTGSIEESVLVEALSAGCVGYVTKGRSFTELVQAVQAAYRGETLVSPDLMPRILKRFRGSSKPLTARPTKREVEILQRLARGLANESIATELGLSVFTVRKHVQNIITKVGAHSKLEAVATAVRHGFVDLD